MASVKIVANNADEAIKEMEIAKERVLTALGMECEKDAKLLCPVDTGRLRNSITNTHDSDYAYIGTNVEYAVYVHEGHGLPSGKSVPPRRFLKNALINNKQKYKQMAEQALKGFTK